MGACLVQKNKENVNVLACTCGVLADPFFYTVYTHVDIVEDTLSDNTESFSLL